jgi:AcrR family transcriptional regulator
MKQVTRKPRPVAAPTDPASSTRGRILDTAELLFAREGPTAVTLRAIAAAADVNVAAVSYHFGSKEKLFEEMFLRRVVPLNDERLTRLASCATAAGGRSALEAIVAAYVMPALELMGGAGAGARAIVVQYSLGRVLAMPSVDDLLVRYYDSLRKAFVTALAQAAPHLAEHEVVWRYYWMGGSVLVSLAVPPEMVEVTDTAVSLRARRARAKVGEELVAFLVKGFGGAGDNVAADA